jgi:hypothetical protein
MYGGLEHFSPFLFYVSMSFTINLKPSPAAEYFTIRDHLQLYNKPEFDAYEAYKNIVVKLKQLFGIPDELEVSLQRNSDLRPHLAKKQILIKDNPATGSDLMNSDITVVPNDGILDLSYSFPQVHVRYSDFNSFLIDPAISLGVPGDYIFYAGKKIEKKYLSNEYISAMDPKMLYLLEAVLDDYLTKGMEMLVRESNYKAAVLYQMIEDSANLKLAVDRSLRSKTIIMAYSEPNLLSRIRKMGYDVAHTNEDGSVKMVMASYPTHSKELIEMFADRITAL